MSSQPRSLRVAVIQLRVELGEVERNLAHVEDLVRQCARETGAELILLPESMTTPNLYAPVMRTVARPIDGEPFQLLRRLARELGCFVGGGFVAVRGEDAKGTYVLAEPSGAAHLHDKDQPTLWENFFYTGSEDDGFCSTSIGPVGLANGFEWARTRTAVRLRGGVRLVAGGSCWWSFPDWRLTRAWLMGREHAYNVAMAREMVARMARIVGAPAAIAQHVGPVTCDTPGMPGVKWSTVMVGESQIVERDGHVLAHLTLDDGEAWAAADVTLADPQPLDPLPKSFWMPVLPASFQAAWGLQNAHGRVSYNRTKRRGGFPWQAWPRRDLPNYLPAGTGAVPDEVLASERVPLSK